MPALDPRGGEEIYRMVKTIVQSGGAAILIDSYDDFESDCTRLIKASLSL